MPHMEQARGTGDLHMVRFADTHFAIEQIDVAHKVRHETTVGVFVHVVGRAHLQQAAFAHDRDAVGHGHGLVLVVGHHDAGDADFFDDVDQFDLGFFAQFFVQRAQRFIQHQQLRALDQTARQRHALLLAA